MAEITLTATARLDKYGLVVVNNPDGSFNREYKISGDELSVLHKSGNGVPPGCTAKEWHVDKLPVDDAKFDQLDAKLREAGLGPADRVGEACASVYGKEMDVGDVKVSQNRQGVTGVTIKYAEPIDQFTGRLAEQFLFIPDDQYTGKLPNISVDAGKLPKPFTSLVDGVLTLEGK